MHRTCLNLRLRLKSCFLMPQPAGVYTNAFLSNEQAAVAIADKRIRGVALTGSERAGSAVGAEAGKALKKSTMELGGSDAFIVLDDADMDIAIKWGVWGRMNNAGQCCIGAKRFILDEKIADVFIDRFSKDLEKLVPGDPADDKTTLGPLCAQSALELVGKQIKAAIDGGEKVLLGGRRMERHGYFLELPILTNINTKNPAYYEEFFAAVALIFRVKNEDEAIKLANDSPYGLGGTVITKDVERGKRVARQIDTGMVFINQATWSAPNLPFGGVKIPFPRSHALLESIPITKKPANDPEAADQPDLLGLRDRALIAMMVFSFARIGAVIQMKVGDYFVQGRRRWVRLHEKGGKEHDVPCHHRLDQCLHDYIEAAGIADDVDGYLFRTVRRNI